MACRKCGKPGYLNCDLCPECQAPKGAVIEYKCRRCGAIDASLHGGEDLARYTIIALAVGVKPPDAGGFVVDMTSTHHCDDNGMGISDLIGYSVES